MEPEIAKDVSDLKISNGEEDIVDPWNVTSTSQEGVDYDKLISKPYGANMSYVEHIVLKIEDMVPIFREVRQFES